MATTSLNAKARALALAMLEATKPQPDVIPEGWLNSHQLAEVWGISVSKVLKKIHRAANKFEVRRFAVQTMRGVRPAPYYRLKTPQPAR